MALYDLYESECSEVTKSTTSEPRPRGMTGRGYGCQYFSIGDPAYKGIWLHELYDVENGFKDANGILVKYTADQFAARQIDYQWRVTTRRRLMPLPGDFIKFHPTHGKAEELSLTTMEKNETGDLVLELGGRQPDFTDAWEASQNVSQGYTAGYMLQSHIDAGANAADFFINDPTHFSAPLGSLTFAVPTDVLNVDLHPRVTLDLSIGYKTEKLLTVGCCAVEILKGGVYLPYGNIIGWTPGQDIKTIDCTDWITANASNVFTIGVYMANEYRESHGSYSDHPVLTADGTMKFWKRKDIL
jgi:hypothetical protein